MRLPSTERTWPGSNGSIMPCASAMRRIHLSLLMLMGLPGRLLVVLDDDLREHGRAVLALACDARGHAPGAVAVDRRDRTVRIGHHGGLARIGLLADAD